ncbi:DNase-RNase domain-containing protein [Cephalotus follicularis]|uniref:DNase-RNase domain-containing protein n=1 Tax=Cephalotus follicularis TaxID=3775 RepID=A0A1Q3CEB7_CEPFO|nr:DNase-RNase domain-containing protein [Cephalotus follicularis]
MLRAQFDVRAVPVFGVVSDQRNVTTPSSITNSLSLSSCRFSIRLGSKSKRCRAAHFVLVSCKSSSSRSTNDHDHDHDREYLLASLLVSETTWHYRMRRQGFREEMRWQSSSQLLPFNVQARESRPDLRSVAQGILRRFQNPTIFLKISCDGDFLLPIVVGEFSIERLIDSLRGNDNGDCPDQFEFVKNVVQHLGYEVKMVRITERVLNTYFAKLYFSKPGKNDILSVDVRPSDAINVANRCKAPIYVSKQIVLADAIRIGYGMGRARDTKSIYDVTLDSAIEGPDLLTEELNVVKNLNLAVKEERYDDAVMWRDRLTRLRKSTNDH